MLLSLSGVSRVPIMDAVLGCRERWALGLAMLSSLKPCSYGKVNPINLQDIFIDLSCFHDQFQIALRVIQELQPSLRVTVDDQQISQRAWRNAPQ